MDTQVVSDVVETLLQKYLVCNRIIFFNRTDRDAALYSLCEQSLPSQHVETAYQKILEREKVGSTAIGKKVALPHCTMSELDDFVVSVGISAEHSITNWETLDREQLHIVVLILAPSGRRADYLGLLSEISKKLGQKDVIDALMHASSAETVVKIFHS